MSAPIWYVVFNLYVYYGDNTRITPSVFDDLSSLFLPKSRSNVVILVLRSDSRTMKPLKVQYYALNLRRPPMMTPHGHAMVGEKQCGNTCLTIRFPHHEASESTVLCIKLAASPHDDTSRSRHGWWVHYLEDIIRPIAVKVSNRKRVRKPRVVSHFTPFKHKYFQWDMNTGLYGSCDIIMATQW